MMNHNLSTKSATSIKMPKNKVMSYAIYGNQAAETKVSIEQQQKVSSSPKIYSPLLNCSGGRLLVLVGVDCNIAAGHHLPALPPPPAAAAIKFC